MRPNTELELHTMVADYLRLQYPTVLFHSDFGSGVKLTMGQAVKQKRLNGGRRAWPDLFIAERSREGLSAYREPCPDKWEYFTVPRYMGLFIELKKEGTKIYKKNGELVADEHIREQAAVLKELRKRGYRAEFAIGFNQAKTIIDSYLGQSNENF
jgi:hypothetical protein